MAMPANHEFLKSNEGKFFEFRFSDGEKTVGKLLSVDLQQNEFIYEMTSTNEPTRYQNRNGLYAVPFADLIAAELLDRE